MTATLSASAGPAVAGQELVVTVAASAPVADLRVALVCTEQHRAQTPTAGTAAPSQTGANPPLIEQSVDLLVDLIPDPSELVEHVEVVQTIEVGALDGTREVRFALPDDAPPTTTDLIAWTVRAFGAGAGDGPAPVEAPVVVVSARVPAEEAATHTGTGDGDREQLRLDFPGGVAMVRAGDVLSGALVVQPGRSMKLTEVRVRLELLHRDTVDFRRIETIAEIDVSDALELEGGTVQQLPFTLAIPADLPPSFRTARNAVSYVLHVSAARRLRSDLKSSVHLYVLSGAA